MENSRQKAIEMIRSSNKMVIFTGAGVSTHCGIPDFRGPGGLYETAVEKYGVPYAEAVFDLAYFRKDPRPFFVLSRELFLTEAEPGLSHKLTAALEEQGKVSLVMTQNIDILHQKAGTKKILPCHGSYETASCQGCGKKYSLADIEADILADRIPLCHCSAVIKPDVVFFGENLPDEFYSLMENPPPADLILILGTSLTVQPASLFALNLVSRVPSILVNLEQTDYDDEMTVALREDVEHFAEAVAAAIL